MVNVFYSKLLCANNVVTQPTIRHISKYIQKDNCSKVIREKFLEYFASEHNHIFVKSSPVIPYCDPTLAFVNAGMNQFKGVFLGTQSIQHSRVVNYQKCVRVGGKHNDMDTVGRDGHHHTFFEMLGNWSFGDYFKMEACNFAWDLLTNVYKLPKSRFYVTYFKGDKTLGIEEDTETKDIWKQIGLPEDRIIPFGTKDNFWEMGLTGPCGPCTEIHIDHIGSMSRPQFVNKGLHDLTEVWNIVFIEYNRQEDGSVKPLPKKHVDTGMGFERLVSIIQGKTSDYDTDNFIYLMNAIHKSSKKVPKYRGKFGENDWNSVDTAYRILADHARMITACLSDGMIPEQKIAGKLHMIYCTPANYILPDIPQVTSIGFVVNSVNNYTHILQNGLLKELTKYVVENLGPFYPEMERNIAQVHQIIDYEEDIYKSLRQTTEQEWNKLIKDNEKLSKIDIIESPGFITAYKEIFTSDLKEIDSKLAFKLFDTYGLDEESIMRVSKALNLKYDVEGLKDELEKVKFNLKESNSGSDNEIYSRLVKENIPKTEDSYKYSYSKNSDNYIFKDLNVKILKIFENETAISEVESGYYCSLLLDKTNLYSEAGGQISDSGLINFKNGLFEVVTVENINGYILHKGFFKSDNHKLSVNASGVLSVNEESRLNCMRNHTTTHLLNAALKNLKGATCQKSSKVTDKYLMFDVAIFGDKLKIDEIDKIEKQILDVIRDSQPVNIYEIDSQRLLSYDVITLIPGEIYPADGIRLVEIKDKEFTSREPCCGTHILNTKDIEDFCIVNIKSLGRSTTSISAVTGERAKLARLNATELTEQIDALTKNIDDNFDKPDLLAMIISTLKRKLNYNVESESILPICARYNCVQKLETINKQLKDSTRENLKDLIEIEMQNALDSNIKLTKSNRKYIIHYLRTSMVLESVPLQKATKLCPDIPILVISYADNMVKARCCIPKKFRSESFNAEKWMKESVADVFKSRAAPPKGQDGTLVCNMKAKKVLIQDWDPLLNECLEKAQRYVEENL